MAAQVAALTALHLVMPAQAQVMGLAGAPVGKQRPLQAADIQLVGHPGRQAEHLPHHGLPGSAVGRDPAMTGKHQQMGQLMGDHLVQKQGLVLDQQHRIQADFPSLQMGCACRLAALVITQPGSWPVLLQGLLRLLQPLAQCFFATCYQLWARRHAAAAPSGAGLWLRRRDMRLRGRIRLWSSESITQAFEQTHGTM